MDSILRFSTNDFFKIKSKNLFKNLLFFSAIFLALIFGSTLNAQILHSSTDSVIIPNSYSAVDRAGGFHFSPTQDLYVAKLGKRVSANGTYSWVLWDFDTKTKIYQQNSQANSPGSYVYEDVTSRSPIVLEAGKEYALILYGIGTTYMYEGTSSQIGDHLTYYDCYYYYGVDTNSFPTNQISNYHFGTPDFLYSLTPLDRGMNDATVLSVDSPSIFCAGMQDIYATIANFGYNQIDSVDIYWEFNGILQPVIEYKQLLDTLNGNNPHTAQIFLGSAMFANGVANTIKVWTSDPNGVADTVNGGDSLEVVRKAALFGSITIDPSQAQSSTNYQSFSSLASDLNNFGVCGPLNVTVAPGTYSDHLSLNDIPGSNSTNTITIDGQNASSVTLRHTAKAPFAAVTLNGSKYVSIKNMTVERFPASGGSSGGKGSGDGCSAVIISGDAEYNLISDNILKVDTASTSSTISNVVFSGSSSSSTSGAKANYNTVENNTIIGGYYGVYLQGSQTEIPTLNRILNNKIYNQYYFGISAMYSDSTEVIGNEIDLSRNTYSYGMRLYYSNNFIISKNDINLQTPNGYGIYCYNYSTYTPANRRIQISNNMVIAGGTGLYAYYLEDADIFHNSVSTFGRYPAALFYSNSGGIDIRNNIFSAVDAEALETTSPHAIFYRFDNNAFYSENSDLFRITNTGYSDLADYHTDYPFFNVSSIEGKPGFLNPTEDLHIFSSTYGNDIGDNSVNIAEDIDGDVRPMSGSTTVDMGADEFEPPVCFAPVNVTAFNAGLDSISLSWEGGLGNTFQYEIVSKGQNQNPANVVTTNLDEVREGNLDHSTAYEYYVRQICAPGDTSPWRGPIEFYTKFLVSFVEDFESSYQGLDNGWTVSTTSMPLWSSGVSSNYPGNTGPDMDHTIGSGGIFAFLFADYNAGSSNLTSPIIVTDTNKNLELTFWYHMYGTDMGALNVYVDTNGVSNLITSINGPQQTFGSAPWQKFSTYLIGYEGQDLQIRFEGVKGRGSYSAMAIDDVSLEIVPSLNVGLVDLDRPFCAGSFTPTVNLKNFGQEDVDSVKIYWEVNGALDSMMYNTTLLMGDVVPVSLSSINLMSTSIYDIKFYTSRPNSTADIFNSNDTLKFENVKTGLSGTYTIDASLPASTSNYISFASAIADLEAFGVCGPTTFNVAAGTYNEAVRINEILGASSMNTVTFDGGSAANTSIVHDGSAAFATITLSGADYITLNNLHIEFTGSNGASVLFAYGADHNTISNSELIVDSNSTAYELNNIVFSGNDYSATSGAMANYNTIENNTLNGGYASIYMQGSTASILVSNKIFNNEILNGYYYGVQAFYTDSTEIIGNRFVLNPMNQYSYGIYIYYSNNSLINKNYIHIKGYYGIYYYNYNTYRPANRRIEINNNMVIADGTYMYGSYGMYLNYVDSVDILHNSISVHGQNPAIRLYSYSDYDLRNNILSSATGSALDANGAASFNNMDNNLYRTNGSVLLDINGIEYADLATYQAAAPGFNISSIVGNPEFVSQTDLHIYGSFVNDKGTSTYVSEDIDGDSRPISGATNVDIGADEFNPPSCPPLLNLSASNIGTSSADIHWTGVGTEFEYQLGVPGFAIGSAMVDSIVVNDTTSLIGLNSSTAYEYYVREICGRGDTSIWTGPYTFITQCTPVSTYPYVESFESGNGGWFTEGVNNTWELGVPNNTIIDKASHGNNAWVTGLETNYNDNEVSQVLSTCFDFTNLEYPSIEMDVFWNIEYSWDGANLQASTDGGATWSNVGAFGDPNNWYTDNTIDAAPGGSQEGWTGRNSTSNGSGQWVRAKHELYALAGLSDVLLRVNFAADGYLVDEGFAFDNIWIGDKVDLDASLASVVDPAGAFCTGTYSPIVEVRNEGKDTINSVKVIYSINGVLDSVLYTGTILPFGSQNVSLNSYTFNSGVTYDIHIYTQGPNGGIDEKTSNDSLSIIGIQTGLSGAYTIDASLPSSITNFTSFSAAADALNNNGVCNPVTITLAPGVYNESVTLVEIKGASSVNTVTFDGVDSSTTILSHNGSDTYATLTFDGADYVIVKNLGIETTNPAVGATVLFKDADHNIISNSDLRVTNNNVSQYDLNNIVFSGSTMDASSNSNSDHNTISNSYIDGGYYGVWLYGDADASSVNVGNKILENKIDNVSYYGMYAMYQDSMEVMGNTILSLGNSNGYGIMIYYSTNSLFHENYIHAKRYALYHYNYNTYAPITRNIEFVNNMLISDNGPGLFLYYTTDVSVLHNSVNSNEAAFSSLYGTVSNYDVRNNIFKSKLDYALETTHASTIFSFFDNNAYYTQGPNLFRLSNVDYADLAALQAGAPGFNLASLEGDPRFTSATDLHIDGSFVNDKGDNSVGISVDIDGDPRPMTGSTSVDIGADEFDGPSCAEVQNLSALGATPDSISLMWDGVGSDFQFEIVGFRDAQGTGTIVGALSDSVRVGDLSENTVYDYYVREICGRGDTSAWAGPFTFKTIKEINDLGIVALIQPVNKTEGCYTTAEDVEIAIVNIGNIAADFSIDSADINVEVTGATSQTFDVQLNDNLLNNGLPLQVGDTLFVSMGTLDMTTIGDYTFNSTLEFNVDMFLNNNTSKSVVSNKTAGGTLSSSTTICGSGMVDINATAAVGDLQWQRLVAGTFMDELGADSSSYEVFIDSTTTFRLVACGIASSDTLTITPDVVPAMPSTINDTAIVFCGDSGTAVLTASTLVSGTINWYGDTSMVSVISTGNTYNYGLNTSTQSATTIYSDTFYVSVEDGTNGCESELSMVIGAVICTVGEGEIVNSNTELLIYPNPSKGRFNLIGNNVKDELQISIFNSSGKIVYQLDNKLTDDFNQEIDLSALSKGIYFIKLQGQESMEMRKVVIH